MKRQMFCESMCNSQECDLDTRFNETGIMTFLLITNPNVLLKGFLCFDQSSSLFYRWEK